MTLGADTYGVKTAEFVELKTVYRCLVSGDTFAVPGDTSRVPVDTKHAVRCPDCRTLDISLLSVISVFDCDECDSTLVEPRDARGDDLVCRECQTAQHGGYSTPRPILSRIA